MKWKTLTIYKINSEIRKLLNQWNSRKLISIGQIQALGHVQTKIESFNSNNIQPKHTFQNDIFFLNYVKIRKILYGK